MRIGFVADDMYPGYGGQARASEGHISVLAARGHDVRVLAGREMQPSQPPPGVIVQRLPVFRPGDKMTHFALPAYGPVARLIQWADVVQVNAPTPLAALVCLVARRRRLPVVIGFHTQIETTTSNLRRGRRIVARGLDRWYRYLYDLPTCLTAPTAFAARIVGDMARRPVHVVTNGIVQPSISEDDVAAASRWRASFAGSHLLAYVGRLAPEKAPLELLDLMAHVAIDASLAIVGTGPLAAAMQARSRALGLTERVRFLGYLSETQKHTLLLAADAFVMPSPTELQSIATLEAMARGCAIVAASFDTSAVPDLVRTSGCGILYDPQRLDVAGHELTKLLGDRSRLDAYQDRARAAAGDHDLGSAGDRLIDLYASLTARSAAPT
jgi:1,2-diacylglycerol 3-alpha-glucosyltransferase